MRPAASRHLPVVRAGWEAVWVLSGCWLEAHLVGGRVDGGDPAALGAGGARGAEQDRLTAASPATVSTVTVSATAAAALVRLVRRSGWPGSG